MAVKIRMTRMGRRHRPFFRINAMESRNPRDGRILEKLGHYDPLEKDKEKQVVLNLERIKHWLSLGAIPSDTVAQILLKQGIKCKTYEDKLKRKEKAKAIARAKGKPFNKAEKKAAVKKDEPAAEQSETKTEKKAAAKKDEPAAEQSETKVEKKAAAKKDEQPAPEQSKAEEES
jgi:small subunit ribosomal protein S16